MIVYTKDNCPACSALKRDLQQKGVEFKELHIVRDISREEFMAKFPGVRTVPHVIEGETE